MSERDELIQIIWDNAVADRVKDGKDLRSVPVVRPKVEGMADAILAAGYAKPRIITTTWELDALSAGSVVLDGDVGVRRDDGYWKLSDLAGVYANSEIDLPATVLYEPEPQP